MKASTMVIAVLTLLMWGAVSSSWAAYDAFMKFGNISGASRDARHEGWIEISSFSFGITHQTTLGSATGAGRESSAPSVSEIVVTKRTDSSSPKLLLMTGSSNPLGVRAIIVVCRPGAPSDFLTLTLHNSRIVADSASSGGDRPTESLSLNFTKIEWTYTPQHVVNDASPALTHGSWVAGADHVSLLPAVQRQPRPSRGAMGDGSVRTFADVWRQIQIDLG